MIKCILISAVLFCLVLGCQRNGRPNVVIEQIDPKWEVGKFMPPRLEVPDSIGGKRLWGEVNLKIEVDKSGMMLGYIVGRIIATLDKKKSPIIYSDLRPHIEEKLNSPQGDSLYKAFAPWINQYYHAMQFSVNKDCQCFVTGDTVLMSHSILFEGKKQPANR